MACAAPSYPEDAHQLTLVNNWINDPVGVEAICRITGICNYIGGAVSLTASSQWFGFNDRISPTAPPMTLTPGASFFNQRSASARTEPPRAGETVYARNGTDPGAMGGVGTGPWAFGRMVTSDSSPVALGIGYVLTGPVPPNGNVTAPVGSLYTYQYGGPGSTLYVKEAGGYSDTGWAAK